MFAYYKAETLEKTCEHCTLLRYSRYLSFKVPYLQVPYFTRTNGELLLLRYFIAPETSAARNFRVN